MRPKSVREKISKTLKTKYAKGEIVHPFLGKHLSKAHRNKISDSKAKLRISREELEKLYWIDGLTLSEIAKIYRVGIKSVYTRMAHYRIPRRDTKFQKGCKVKTSRNTPRKLSSGYEKLTSKLAYILGVIYGDGYLLNDSSNHGVVGLAVKDEDFALMFKEYIERWSGLTATLKRKGRLYRVELYSVEAYNFLKNFELDRLLIAPKKIQCAFLKGFYDSEGSVWIENRGKGRPRIRIACYNTNRTLVDLIKCLLTQLDIHHRLRIKPNNQTFKNAKLLYEIIIDRRSSVKKFRGFIGFSIKRKRSKLNEFSFSASKRIL